MSFDRPLFVWLFISFIVATVIGTLTHECGHYSVAKYLGYEAVIDYSSTSVKDTKNAAFIDSTYSNYKSEISSGKDFPGKEKFYLIREEQKKDRLWVTLGGPFETMLTGTIGFILLLLFRKSFAGATELSLRQWLFIFVSLFWLRQSANLVVGIVGYFITGEFSRSGDESRLAYYLGLPEWTIATFTGIIGVLVLAIVIFKFIPARLRLTFICSGLAGGIAGYFLWLVLFGKYLMP